MTGTLRVVLGDQLSRDIAALSDIDRDRDTVLLAEVMGEATYVPHHPKKIAFLFSAMRHFAEALRADGISVRYVALDDDGNTGSFTGEVKRALKATKAEAVVVTHPGEYRVLEEIRAWSDAFDQPVEVREDNRFVASRADFARWAEGRKSLRMEYFYREMRKRTGILMTDDGEPEGGQWNFDHDNRKPLPEDADPPSPLSVEPDKITRAVLDLVGDRFADHFGDLEPFDFAVTAEDAEKALKAFIKDRLPLFGDYQDAMTSGGDTLYHAVISLYMNAGLLDPLKACQAAETAYRKGHAPINAVEGFIRQILGWREYVRGLYWLKMPDYAATNHLNAKRSLPGFYWTGETDMACLAHAIDQTKRLAYAHHIQRLMVTGNFALLIGVLPEEICAWYLAVYADAYEWVELPNTHGMVMYADGGIIASKPYAASGSYIDRMGDYCADCRYSVKQKTGPDACPFNYLYWAFLMDNRETLKGNPRMGMILKTLDRMDDEKRKTIRRDADAFLKRLADRGTDRDAAKARSDRSGSGGAGSAKQSTAKKKSTANAGGSGSSRTRRKAAGGQGELAL